MSIHEPGSPRRRVDEGAGSRPRPGCEAERRDLLKRALGVGVGTLLCAGSSAQDDVRSRRPQPGDGLVFASGERKGEPVLAADVQVDARPLIAYPWEPGSKTVRNASRLNQVLLLRLAMDELAAETRARAAEGVVAYSAVCTHAGCDDWAWMKDNRTLKCPCHDSEFNPRDAARVTVGPATRRLAALPLTVADGALVVKGEFTGRVGIQP